MTGENELEMSEKRAAVAGREYWIQLKEQYLPDEETGLIIVQTKEQDMIDTAIRLIPVYMKRKYLKRVLVVTDRETAAKVEKQENPDAVTIVAAQRDQMEELLAYYRLVQFFHEIAVVSVEEPYGNANIIGKAGITLEDYVKNALYV